MAALKAAVIGMGLLIVAGVTVIVVTLVQRASAPTGAALIQATLDEPAGTRIAGVAAASDRLAVQLQGGGPDRVVVVDLRTGRVLARAGLAR
jgi:hypothetical protein